VLPFWRINLEHKIDCARCLASRSGTLCVSRIYVFGGFCIRFFEDSVDAPTGPSLVDVHHGFFITTSIREFDVRGLVGTAIVRELQWWAVSAHAPPLTCLAQTITVSATN